MSGLKDGTIDVLTSGHTPHEEESKNLEFDLSDFGMINLQTFASNLVTLSQAVELEVLIEKVTSNPRKLLGLDVPKIDVEEKADLTLFDPNKTWTFDEKVNLSKSRNSPWLNKEIKGKAVAVFNNGRTRIDE